MQLHSLHKRQELEEAEHVEGLLVSGNNTVLVIRLLEWTETNPVRNARLPVSRRANRVLLNVGEAALRLPRFLCLFVVISVMTDVMIGAL